MSIKNIIGGDQFRWRHVAFMYALMVVFACILQALPKEYQVFNFMVFIHMIGMLIAGILGAAMLILDKEGGKW